jgi:RNA polymerase sigma-70 factor (ECF subfamily)
VNTPTDGELMQSVQAGKTAELAHLFERHHLGVFRYVLSLTRNQPLAEDITQDAFFRVLTYAQTYGPGQPFLTWLYKIARNASIDAMRRSKGASTDGQPDLIRSTAPMPDELFTHSENLTFLNRALNEMSRDKREVLILSRFQNLKYEEIARILECEVGTVKVRVYRALRELTDTFRKLTGETTL